ncbi:hypothetical protein WJX77_005013 [Trebouxia sp. C0004]
MLNLGKLHLAFCLVYVIVAVQSVHSCWAPPFVDQLVDGWTLCNLNGSISIPTRVPGYALQTLYEQGLIEPPLSGFHELAYRWIAEDTWNFSTSFSLNPEALAFRQLDLHFMGLDTDSQIFVNTRLVAEPANAFREHCLAMKHLLQQGKNTLEIIIHPASTAAKRRYNAYRYEVPTMYLRHMTPHYNFLRKPPADFGWDWGPTFAPAGIYGGVVLVGHDSVYILGANVRQQHSLSHDITLYFDVQLQWAVVDQQATICIQADGNHNWMAQQVVETSLEGQQTHTVQMKLSKPYELWWPVGYGKQKMYTFTISVEPTSLVFTKPAESSQHCGSRPPHMQFGTSNASAVAAAANDSEKLLHQYSSNMHVTNRSKHGDGTDDGNGRRFTVKDGDYTRYGSQHATVITRRIGLREVELRTEELEDGESFVFMVNGVPIYAKGANMIIADILPTRADRQRYRSLVDSAVAAHMNMIRVWGGGLYPPQDFYDLCDERGVLVWQEAMMACALYPRDQAFLQEIHTEVQFQMRRINWHPSLVIWGGNNEVETAMDGWFDVAKQNPQLYVADYTKLFLDTVQTAVAEVDPEFPFVDSSPSNGLISKEPYIKRWGDASSPYYGDAHFYNYDADSFDAATYPHARFVSEFGFQSLPSWTLYKNVTRPEDWSWDCEMSQFRMRHPNGTLQLLNQARRHFNVSVKSQKDASGHLGEPPNAQVFKRWTYLSQVQQAITYETAIGLWRRLKGTPAHTMGILYWQLNDVWLGASWSSMDFGGKWRLLHYSMKRMYAPCLISAHRNRTSGQIEVWLVSDINEPVTGTLQVDLVAFDAISGPEASHSQEFSLQALESKEITLLCHDPLLLSFFSPSTVAANNSLKRSQHFVHLTAIKRDSQAQEESIKVDLPDATSDDVLHDSVGAGADIEA